MKEKGSALWRKTKEELLSFNIPGPAAPPPSKPPSPTVSPTITKKATYLTFPNLLVNKGHQCSVPHCVSSEYCWLYHCPEGILGNKGSSRVSGYRSMCTSRKQSVPQFCVAMFLIAECQSSQGHTPKHERVSVLSRYLINRIYWQDSTCKYR